MNREKMEKGENSVYTTRGGREKRERWMHMRIYVCRSDEEKKKKVKRLQHSEFPGCLQPYYYPSPKGLNFTDRTRSGALPLVWP